MVLNEKNNNDDDDDEEETFYVWSKRKLNSMFISSLPMDAIKDLPPVYMYTVGAIVQLCAFLIFLYFIYQGYTSAIQQQFMSLQSSAGACEEVPAPITGSYLADSNGYWSLEVTSNEYKDLINDVREYFTTYVFISERQSLAGNLLMWMVLSNTIAVKSSSTTSTTASNVTTITDMVTLQEVTLTGSPAYVFNRKYHIGNIINKTSTCSAMGITSFDQANAKLVLGYSYSEFMALGCGDIIDPSRLGYSSSYSQKSFEIALDINSLVVSMGVSTGLLNIGESSTSSLQQVANGMFGDHTTESFTYEGIIYSGATFIDKDYPGMEAIFCINGYSVDPTYGGIPNIPQFNNTCVLKLGQTFGFPVFNHYGTNVSQASLPIQCDCMFDGGGPDSTWTNYCNVFDLLVGVIIFPEIEFASPNEVTKELPLLSLLINYSPQLINSLSFNASRAAIALMLGGDPNPIYTNQDWRNDAFDFCTLSEFNNISCIFVSFNLNDDESQSVSQYSYQLTNGSCSNTISISENSWENLANTPPTELVQDYYKCTDGELSAMFNAVGIASGNVSIVIPLVVVLFLPLMYVFLQAIGQVPPKQEYEEEEIKDAVEALARQMLRMRDGKTRGLKLHGALYHLTKELVQAAKQEGGYPDSDDSSSCSSGGNASGSSSEIDSDDEDLRTSSALFAAAKHNNNNVKQTIKGVGGCIRRIPVLPTHSTTVLQTTPKSDADETALRSVSTGSGGGKQHTIEMRSSGVGGGGQGDVSLTLPASPPRGKYDMATLDMDSVAGDEATDATHKAGTTHKNTIRHRHQHRQTTSSHSRHTHTHPQQSVTPKLVYREGGKKQRGVVFTKHMEESKPNGHVEATPGGGNFFTNFFSSVGNRGTSGTSGVDEENPMHNQRRSDHSSASMAHRSSSGRHHRHTSHRHTSHRHTSHRRHHPPPMGVRISEFNRHDKYKDVLVLNLPPEGHPEAPLPALTNCELDANQVLTIDKLPAVFSELKRLLGECVLYEQRSSGASMSVVSEARDCSSFAVATLTSHYLSKVDVQKLMMVTSVDKSLFLQMHTLLCMHASIALSLPVMIVTDSYSKQIAYQIGNQHVFTARDIHLLCGDDSAFRESIAQRVLM